MIGRVKKVCVSTTANFGPDTSLRQIQVVLINTISSQGAFQLNRWSQRCQMLHHDGNEYAGKVTYTMSSPVQANLLGTRR